MILKWKILRLIYFYSKKNVNGIFLTLWKKSLLETHKKYFLKLDSTQLRGIEIFKVMLNSVFKINFYIIMSGIKYHTRGSKQAVFVII